MSATMSNASALRSLVDDRIESWRAGDAPDAVNFLSEHPELARVESLVLDLVQEEYCLRAKAGETLNKDRLYDRLPAYRRSIEKMFEVEEFLDQCPQFALADQRVPWPVPGREFLGYEVVKELGSGTFACVFFAREPDLGHRPVVIKVSRYGMFEAGTLGRLSHPNIMPIHSVQYDQATGWTAICMPLLGTATAVELLQAAFAKGQPTDGAVIARVAATARPIEGIAPAIDAEESRQWRGPYADAIARLGQQLAEGLQQAHAAGIRHHDIKPSNVLLSWSGWPLLLDFNLALDDLAVVNRPGGTQEYLAPELVAHWRDRSKRDALREDPRCDIYSLGAVLYQLLVNRLPAADGTHPPLRSLNPAIDSRLDKIILKCLAVDPDQRYGTAGELAADLREYLSLPLAARRFVSRHRRGFLVAGAAVVAGVFSGAAYVASLKPYPERLLDQGLEEFKRSDYLAALVTFDRCVELSRSSPEARFARGQTLLRLQRWNDARTDFTELRNFHKGWAYALTGYCHMRAGDLLAAYSDYYTSYNEGVRDIRLLLNYADVQRRRKFYSLASEIYTEALGIDPDCAAARRGRAHAVYCIAFDRLKVRVLPNPQVFEDAREDIRLNPDTFVSYYLGAVIFGYAVQIDPSLGERRYEGAEYLKQALLNGLPRESFVAASQRLEPLMTDELWRLVARAPALGTGYMYDFYEQPEFPRLAEWGRFLEAVGESR